MIAARCRRSTQLQREIEEQGDPDHRRAASRWRSTCARSSARCASPPTSSASAISPRTSPSARWRSTGDFRPQKLIRGVEHMAELVLAPAEGRARRLCRPRRRQGAWRCGTRDEEIDAMYTSLFRELLTYMMEDPRNITFCTHLLFCAKNIERIGDHATNIAETVYYMIEGATDRRSSARRATRPASADSLEQRSESRARMKPRILIVEDEEALAQLLRYNLEAEGYAVETRRARRRGRGARCKEHAPDLVMLDWMLPGLSGIELCRRLRARPGDPAAADHHADGARRGERSRARARHRRRRLRRQAVLAARTDGARARAAAPRHRPSASPTCSTRRHRARPREAARHRAAAGWSISGRPSSGCSNS